MKKEKIWIIPEGVTEISKEMVQEHLKQYPDIQKIVIKGCAVIKERAFKNQNKITEVECPAGLRCIEEYAFYGSGLRQLDLKVDEMKDYALEGAEQLSSLLIESANIPDYMCINCPALKNIVIKKAESIGTGAFAGTKTGILKLSESVKKVGELAFDGYSGEIYCLWKQKKLLRNSGALKNRIHITNMAEVNGKRAIILAVLSALTALAAWYGNNCTNKKDTTTPSTPVVSGKLQVEKQKTSLSR